MKSLYIVQVTGDRHWDDYSLVLRELKRAQRVAKATGKELLVVHGGAEGADTMSGQAAKSISAHTARVDALWDTRYRGAGPQRNGIMVAMFNAHENLAFHPDLERSRGTKDMVKQLRKQGRTVKLFDGRTVTILEAT